jgi:peptidoglycan/LPS O-acetylase OafA/YrhL
MIPGTTLSETEVPAKAGRRVELGLDALPGHGASENAAPSVSYAVPRFYRPELDALRLVAFLMVWFSHSLPSAGEGAAHALAPGLIRSIEAIKDAGNFGVCVFFFLSAYLITELLRRERVATGAVHLRAFYLRRILRIWPLYLGVLAAYGLLGLRFHGFRIEPGRLLASLLLAGNWYIAFHPAILTPMRALWSLSVEEQFYLGWPVLARFARPPLIAGVCLLLLLIGQLTLVWLARDATRQSMLHVTAWVNSLVQFQFFALGALAALALSGRHPRFPLVLRSALFLAACAAMLAAAGVCGIKRPQPWHSSAALTGGYLLTGLGCVLLFAAVLGLPARTVPPWAVRLGQVSFGLYVFHETGFFFADTLEKHLRLPTGDEFQNTHWVLALAANKALSLAFTIGLAFASYHFWEKPFLRLKDRFTFIQTRRA